MHVKMRLVRTVFCTFLFLTSIKSQQCPVDEPTIVSSSSSEDLVCAVVSQESLTYICNNNENTILWSSSVFTGTITVIALSNNGMIAIPVPGVTLTENDNDNATCLNSTLTFTGSLTDLTQLNGVVLNCSDGTGTDTVTIQIPVLAEPPMSLMNISSPSCGSNGNQVTLQWTLPTNTGGQGVMITHYVLTGLPQSASCSTGPSCDMITGTSTTITGLQCNTNYNVSVSAVNCRGVSNASDPIIITVDAPDVLSPSIQGTPCFDGSNNIIIVSLMNYTNICLSNMMFVVSSNCSEVVIESPTNVTEIMLPVNVSTNDSCEVNVFVRSDCGDSSNATMIISTMNNSCPTMAPISTPTLEPSSASPLPTTTTSISITPTIPAPTPDGGGPDIPNPTIIGIIIAVIVIAALVVLTITIILVCIYCPCGCCMPCRRKCCCCCSEEKICCTWGSDNDYSEPTPHVEKQPVLLSCSTETKEKDVETGQPTYPSSSGPMYQDPNTIERVPAPTTGALYAQPEKPARHQQKQKPPPAMEMPTYQDPSTIQRTAAPTGDLYAQPDKPPKQPSGPAPVYSEVNKSNAGGLVYADLSHSESPANVRRPAPVGDTVYSEVRESRQ